MPTPCPRCHSSRVGTLNTARKTGGVIGLISSIYDLGDGQMKSYIAPPLYLFFRSPLPAIAGAIAKGLLKASHGIREGSEIGLEIDRNILNNYVCYACGHRFSTNEDNDDIPPEDCV